MEIKKGQVWRHYKNHNYEIVEVGIHSETLEEMVVYKSLYEGKKFPKGTIWVRPKSLWFEEVDWDGKKRQRFELIKK